MGRKKIDNSDLFAERERKESHMILEVRENCRRVADTFDNLKLQHFQYIQTFGRTWLTGG